MRILISPVEISGFYRALNTGFREIGVDSTFAELWPNPYQYGIEEADLRPPVSWARALARRYRASNSKVGGMWWLTLGGLARLAVFLWALPQFDVFVFGFGATILFVPAFELRVLSALGKKIVFHFHGSDTRPPYMDGYMDDIDPERRPRDFARMSREIKKRVSLIDRYADVVVDSPLSGHFHSRPCVNCFAIGLPSVEKLQRSETGATERTAKVRIVHAPSNLPAKGTEVIRRAIEELGRRGLELEYVEIVGQSNEKVLEELRRCDFVIDQLYSDTPMAGFAAEAARAGKPAIVCGYAADEFRRWIPPEATPPTHYCHPSELVAAIERMATDKPYRLDLGSRARSFFAARCRPRDVAARYLKVLRGEEPSDWVFDPQAITYIRGCGLDEARARNRISGIVKARGPSALQLADKPLLEGELVRFAANLTT